MSYNGWVPYRRGIIEHVLDGRLKGLEHYALSQLILMADASTGGYNVNAPILTYWCGYVFNLDTSERILRSLHQKGYIWYRGLRGSKCPQPYWINKYKLSRGQFATRMTNLSQLLDNSTISQDDVFRSSDHHADQDADEHTDNYKKREKKLEKKPLHRNDATNDAENDARNDATNDATEEGRTMNKAEHALKGNDADDACMTHAEARDANDANDASSDATSRTRRVRIVTGPDAHYIDADSGQRLPGWEARAMLEVGTALEVTQ